MRKLIIVLFIICGILVTACRTLPPPPQVVTALSGPERIDKYGGLHFDMTAGAFLTNVFAVSNTVVVAIAGNEVSMPVVENYRHVAPGEFALVASPEPTRPLFTTIFYGDAASRLGIAHRLTTAGGKMTTCLLFANRKTEAFRGAVPNAVAFSPHFRSYADFSMPLPSTVSGKVRG